MLNMSKKKIAGLLVGGMLLVGSVANASFADSDTQTTKEQTKDQYFQEFISDFAKNLKVDEDQVTQALEATKKQMLQNAVQQGKITQEQADKIAAKKDFFFMGNFDHAKRHKVDLTQNPNFLNAAASALGINADDLKSKLQSGTKLEQIITEQGMTMEEFRQKMPKIKGDITQNTDFLNAAATALEMTADELKSELQSGKKLEQIITEKGKTMEEFRQKMPVQEHMKKYNPGSSSTGSTSTNS
jgi:hypothetical protein